MIRHPSPSWVAQFLFVLCVSPRYPLRRRWNSSYTDVSRREPRRMETRGNEDTSTVIATLGETPVRANTHGLQRAHGTGTKECTTLKYRIGSCGKSPAWARTRPVRKARLFSGLTRMRSRRTPASEHVMKIRRRRATLNAGDVTSHVTLCLRARSTSSARIGGQPKHRLDRRTERLFAEAYACTPGSRLTVSVVATRKVRVLTFEIRAIMEICRASCPSITDSCRILSHHSR